jgi:hypothetical protein
VAGDEHQAGVDPRFSGAVAVGFLLMHAEPECIDAQIEERERCL